MNVKELINELEKIEDKECDVMLYQCRNCIIDIDKVTTLKMNNGDTYIMITNSKYKRG